MVKFSRLPHQTSKKDEAESTLDIHCTDKTIPRIGSFFFALLLTACGGVSQPCPPPTGDVVYVVEQDWHTEIGVPVDQLSGDMKFFSQVFPGARVLMFGYGKQTFFTAPPDTISEYILGPFPGPAVIQVVGLNAIPPEAYPHSLTLALPPGGAENMARSIWNDLVKNDTGSPFIIAPSTDPAGIFYAAQSEYNLLHTCNTWVAERLHDAGLPVDSDALAFSGQTMARAEDAAAGQCPVTATSSYRW